MLFNINEKVRVKLTDTGREIYLKQWLETMPANILCKLPLEDEQGWSEWQLWGLMNTFGPHCRLGSVLPFDTTIELILRKSND